MVPFFLESIFQDPCPTLNGTRRVTMPQVLTRRSEPITLLAKRGHLHLQTQKLALVLITQPEEAEAHGLTARSHLVVPTTDGPSRQVRARVWRWWWRQRSLWRRRRRRLRPRRRLRSATNRHKPAPLMAARFRGTPLASPPSYFNGLFLRAPRYVDRLFVNGTVTLII